MATFSDLYFAITLKFTTFAYPIFYNYYALWN